MPAFVALRRSLPVVAAVALVFAIGAASPAHAMSYSLARVDRPGCGVVCPPVVAASGMIEFDEEEAFASFLAKQGDAAVSRTLLIRSTGGYGAGGVKLGAVLRKLRFDVVVGEPGRREDGRAGVAPGVCASACVFVLAGGVRRSVAGGSVVAVHRPFPGRTMLDEFLGRSSAAEIDYPKLGAAIAAYFKLMGVTPQLAVVTMRTPSSGAHILTARELSRFRVTSGPG